MRLLPNQAAPPLFVSVLAGGRWDLARDGGERGTLIVFHRGLSFPFCASYLVELDRLVGDFRREAVEVVAISRESLETTRLRAENFRIENLKLGYDLSLEIARGWGLYFSESRPPQEDRIYSESGLFFIGTDSIIRAVAVSSIPWCRPDFGHILRSIQDDPWKSGNWQSSSRSPGDLVPVALEEEGMLSFRDGRGGKPRWIPG